MDFEKKFEVCLHCEETNAYFYHTCMASTESEAIDYTFSLLEDPYGYSVVECVCGD